MARNTYDAATRDAFMNAAVEARRAGKPFPEVYEVARAAGYQGSLQGISILVRKTGAAPKRKRGRPAKVKTAADAPTAAKTPSGKKRGRPRKTANAPSAAPVSSIGEMINELVKTRVRAALQKAIAALQE